MSATPVNIGATTTVQRRGTVVMSRSRITRILAAGVLVAGISLAVASPASADASNFIIQNQGNGKCLQPEGASLDLGVAIVQQSCNGQPEQTWSRLVNGDGTFQYRNRLTTLCLDARGGATNGTPIQQWTCNTISNEKWAPSNVFIPAITTLTSRVSGTSTHCLDNPQQGTADGTAMQLWRCNGTDAQSWFTG
jgi:hypothetical protein